AAVLLVAIPAWQVWRYTHDSRWSKLFEEMRGDITVEGVRFQTKSGLAEMIPFRRLMYVTRTRAYYLLHESPQRFYYIDAAAFYSEDDRLAFDGLLEQARLLPLCPYPPL